MYVDVWNRSEIFRNFESFQGLMRDYNDHTNCHVLYISAETLEMC